MKTVILEIPPRGASVQVHLRPGVQSGQLVLVLADGVEIGPPPNQKAVNASESIGPIREYHSENGFPPRELTKQTIVQILGEYGGEVKIRDNNSGWNIYDEVAARLGVSMDARRRLTAGTGEPAWRPEVGFARKELEQAGIIAHTEVSGRGIWMLAKPG